MTAPSSRVTVVTGAARGLGAATALRLAADGMAVAVIDLEESAAKATADAISDAGGRAIAVGADPSNTNGLSATGKPSRVSGTVSGSAVKTATLGKGAVKGGAGPRALSAGAATKVGSLAGAQLEQVTLGDAAGLAATSCSVPESDV